MFKNENGVTLIALVITIVVLLILAGITISKIPEQITSAEKTEKYANINNEKEIVNTSAIHVLEKYGIIEKDKLQEYIDKNSNGRDVMVSEAGYYEEDDNASQIYYNKNSYDFIVTFMDTGKKYTVDGDGYVTQFNENTHISGSANKDDG